MPVTSLVACPDTIFVLLCGVGEDPRLVGCAYEEYTNHVVLSIREYTALYTETAR